MYLLQSVSKRLCRLPQVSIFLFILLLAVGCNAGPQHEARVDPNSADLSSIRLCNHIKDSIAGVSGDIKNQHVHLVVAFSTGHFAKDPLSADAARRMAGGLVSHFLIAGDQLSSYAWEMDVWPHLRGERDTLTLVKEDEGRKERLSSLWPLSPASGSAGGHDTEKAIVEITRRLQGNNDAVIVLITNSAASIGSSEQRVIGQNDPDYLSALSSWRREPQISKSGASITLPFDIVNPDGSILHRSLDAVVLVPRNFSASGIAGRTRPDDVQASVRPVHAASPQRSFPFWILPLALALLALFIAWKRGAFNGIMPRTGPLLLEVAGSTFDVSSVRDREEICNLAANGYESATNRSVFVTNKDGLPPARLARFVKDRGAIEVKGDKFGLYSVDGKPFTGTYRITPGTKCRLCFRGEYSPGPAYPARQVTAEVDASFGRQTASGKG